eukprot:3938978-Rhodomonas_salina.1
MCDDTCSSDGDCLATGAQQMEPYVGYVFLAANIVGFNPTVAPGPATLSAETYSVSSFTGTDTELKFIGVSVDAASAYTVMIWLKMSTASDGLKVISIEEGVRKIWVYKDSGQLIAYAYTDTPVGSGSTLGSPNNFPLNTWLHVALVVNVDGYVAVLYENGAASVTNGGRYYPPLGTEVDVKFMVNSVGGSDGIISDAILHSRVFSATEIDAVYNGRWFDTSAAILIADYCYSHTFDLYACACNAGYSGDGVLCGDADECALGTDDCPEHSDCVNNAGSFTCTCIPPYSGADCSVVDECVALANPCHAEASCTDTLDSYTCACNAGWGGDGEYYSAAQMSTWGGTGSDTTSGGGLLVDVPLANHFYSSVRNNDNAAFGDGTL